MKLSPLNMAWRSFFETNRQMSLFKGVGITRGIRVPQGFFTAKRIPSQMSVQPLRSSLGPIGGGSFAGFSSAFRAIRNPGTLKQSLTKRLYSLWNRFGNRGWPSSPRINRLDFERLKIPLLFTAVLLLTMPYVVPVLFKLPPLSFFTHHPPVLVFTLIAINTAVFFMWKDYRFLKYLMRYGLLKSHNVGNPISLLTSTFSHQSFMHLAFNMIVLLSFGTSMVNMIGPSYFTQLYIGSGVVASMFSLVWSVLKGAQVASLGASGALFGLCLFQTYFFPNQGVFLFFIPIPMPAWAVFSGITSMNVVGMFARWGGYDYAAHVGGSLYGLIYAYYFSKKTRDTRRKYRNSPVWWSY